MKQVIREPREKYGADPEGDEIVSQALRILRTRLRRCGDRMEAPCAVKAYLALHLTGLEREVFAVLFLDPRHRVLAYEEMFVGTLTQTSIYPREVVKRALAHNASAVILAHNHPSGVLEASQADVSLTQTLKTALNLIDVRVLDHIIVGDGETLSMAETGLI